MAHQATTLKPRLEGLGKVGLEVVVHHLVEHSLWGMWPQLVHTQLWSVGDTWFPSMVTVHLSFTEADCGGNTTAILIVFSTGITLIEPWWSPVSVFLICDSFTETGSR